VFVLHQANIPSGGQISQIELRDFLARGCGPEQQALLEMIGTLIESAPCPYRKPKTADRDRESADTRSR
jgi:hypothetical protein